MQAIPARPLRIFGLLVAALMGDGSAPGQESSAPAPEIKTTVDAFAGRWLLTGTDEEPGTKTPLSVNAVVDCKPAALGNAVNCIITADITTTHIEAATIIGYSPDEHRVRWMEISSTGEYHDHRGIWKGHSIEFEPLISTVAGATTTEYLTVSFPGSEGKMAWRSITSTREGNSRLELTGRRAASAPH